MEILLNPAAPPTAAGERPTADDQPCLHVRIAPWIDPVVDRRGHDPRSSYVERTGGDHVFEPGEFVIGSAS